jgi:hypothetical protein
MTRKKKTSEHSQTILLCPSIRREILEVREKPSSKNKLMKDFLKLH